MMENAGMTLAVTHLNETAGCFVDYGRTPADLLLDKLPVIYKSDGKTRENVLRIAER